MTHVFQVVSFDIGLNAYNFFWQILKLNCVSFIIRSEMYLLINQGWGVF